MEHTAPPAAGGALIRRARPEDLPRLVELIEEHVAYERAAPRPPGLADRLGPQLFASDARLWVLVAELPDGTLAGYAACAPEYAFWNAAHHLHMDCLYLAESARGRGVGADLMAAVADLARAEGMTQVQWQTPEWNEGAVRFYDRLGAVALPKLRYSLAVRPEPGPEPESAPGA
ncbi:GNAT family N-acetyltransferase [Streptomyces sp. BI20]|uniref:GNAT family N-acetyltransferase n=1 Tax=Streptomyces sp. BI20 TaxID=3403460 RepID=UPI003C7891F1